MSVFRQALAGLLTAGLAVATVMGGVTLALVEGGELRPPPTGIALATGTLPSTGLPATEPRVTQPAGVTVSAETPLVGLSTPTFATDTPAPTASPFQVLPTACRPPANWVAIQVQPGDTLFRIALRYGLTTSVMARANCLGSTFLTAGMTLHVPGSVPTPEPCGPPEGWVFYTVQRGDNLFRLSLRYGVTLYALQHANCLGSSTGIFAGQQLFVPPATTPTASATATSTATASPTVIPPPPPTNVPPTSTPVPSDTPTATATLPTDTPTVTPTETPTPTNTPTP